MSDECPMANYRCLYANFDRTLTWAINTDYVTNVSSEKIYSVVVESPSRKKPRNRSHCEAGEATRHVSDDECETLSKEAHHADYTKEHIKSKYKQANNFFVPNQFASTATQCFAG